MKNLITNLLLLMLFYCAGPKDILYNNPNTASIIVINEINYKSANNFDSGDWVELYNTTDEIQDISNWVFKDENDNKSFTISEELLLYPNGFIVLCNNIIAFQEINPDVNNIIGELDFGLSGGGELLQLFDNSGNLIDFVDYNDSYPWPTEPHGNGPTLELIDPLSDNNLAENWEASEHLGSPGHHND